jgi:gliding motility-associated-like protein/uncharacterized repeat protein (TIGR01451 family)
MYATAMAIINVGSRVNLSNLYVEKTGPTKALSGSLITYNIIVKNNGPDLARNVILKDSIPFGLFTPEYSLGGPLQPWRGSIVLGNIASGDSVRVTLRARISANTPPRTLLFNQALTYSNSYDVSISDNDSIWRTEVLPLYVDMPDQLMVAGCRPTKIPNLVEGNSTIVSYQWTPSTGLSNDTIPDPWFTPEASTVGRSNPYILTVIDSLGNVASDTILIFVSDIPVATIDSDTTIDGIGKVRFRDLGETIAINGSQSTGDNLNFFWWAENEYGIVSGQNDQLIRIDSLGKYYLSVTDLQECEAIDSVTVLYKSHPPVAIDDYVEIEAGTDSTINLVENDYDLNLFDLTVTRVVTPPDHGTYSLDTLGNINYAPDLESWSYVWDSIEYEVCNNGIPVQCSTGWMVIKIKRPPLNADVVIAKSCPQYAFWDDTIRYNLLIYNNGPDTASVISVEDLIDHNYLSTPTYRVSNNNGATWSGWEPWRNGVNVRDMVVPTSTPSGGTSYRIQLKAFIDPRNQKRGVTIRNKATISTDILENDSTSNVDSCETTLKEKVIARAGKDRTFGFCQREFGIELDGTASSGENITYHWTPEFYFDNPNDSIPTFRATDTDTVEVILTVTDDVGNFDADTLLIYVLPPPMADAGPDRFLPIGESVVLDGSGSRPILPAMNYLWTPVTPNGHILPGTQISIRAGADSLGIYVLRVIDKALCVDYDTVQVFRYYIPPYAIPDYYSTTPGTPISSDGATIRDLRYNDFDPNGLFGLTVTAVVNMPTALGGRVTIGNDGSFTYTPPSGAGFVDYFTYQVCNGTPNGCARGYVKITVSNVAPTVNLSIDKWAVFESVLVGGEIQYVIEVTNKGSDNLNNVVITDTLSSNIQNARYSFDGINFPLSNVWGGDIKNLTLNAGASRRIYIKGTVAKTARGRIYNAAMVSSPTFDNLFDWDDLQNRNVDTASVATENNLIARAELIERFDNNRSDLTVGVCDNSSFLSGINSSATSGIERYNWQPSEFLTSDSTVTTTFNGTASDTTITFTLIVYAADNIKTATVTVTFSPEVIADAGPDRKMNEGEPLTLNPSGNEGAGVTYEWWRGDRIYTSSVQVTNFDGDPLRPIISGPGQYYLYATDQHGCEDIDTVVIRENQLFALNDILVVVTGTIQTGNVGTNDYDPNVGDSIYFPGTVVRGPFHGTLTDNPPGLGGIQGTNGEKISNNGTYIYQPNAGFIGDDYFIYEVCDNNDPKLCVKGKVYIRVIDVDRINSQPVANHDVFFINKNDTLQGNLIANDYDFDGGTVSLIITPVTMPKKGTVTFNSDSTFTYVPTMNAEAADSFQYRIIDNGRPPKYDTAWVNIYIHKIEEENHKPVAVDDAYYVVEKTIRGNLMLNDYDPDGNTISLDIKGYRIQTAHGTVDFDDQYGSFRYTPDAGFEGTDQLIYNIRESGTIEKYVTSATVYFTCLKEKRYDTDLEMVKTGPAEILSGDMIEYTLTATVVGPTLANDVVISDTLSSEHLSAFSRYSTDNGVSWLPWTGSFHIDRLLLYEAYSIRVRSQLIDTLSGNLSNIGWVDHDMTELKPENDSSEWITRVYQKVIANAGNDTIIGSCQKEYQLDGSGSMGMGPLQYRWTPTSLLKNHTTVNPTYTTSPGAIENFRLIVSCTYRGFTDSDTANVVVRVANVPEAVPGEDIWNAVGDTILDGQFSYAYGSISYLWWRYDKEGNLTVIDTTESIIVNRSDEYFLTVTDIFGCVSTEQVNVGYEIEPIIAVDDYIETPQDESVDIFVLRNDIVDKDDAIDVERVVVSSDPSHGQVTWNPIDSSFTYIPDPYYVGYDTFTYIVGTIFSSTTDEAMVVINVLDRPARVPDGFSPNGDGINDKLIIENIEKYPMNSFIVFNRWGNVVYKKEKYSNDEPWDGVANKGVRIGSGALPAGVYLFVLDLGDTRIKKPKDQGNIYIATDNRR